MKVGTLEALKAKHSNQTVMVLRMTDYEKTEMTLDVEQLHAIKKDILQIFKICTPTKPSKTLYVDIDMNKLGL